MTEWSTSVLEKAVAQPTQDRAADRMVIPQQEAPPPASQPEAAQNDPTTPSAETSLPPGGAEVAALLLPDSGVEVTSGEATPTTESQKFMDQCKGEIAVGLGVAGTGLYGAIEVAANSGLLAGGAGMMSATGVLMAISGAVGIWSERKRNR